jgi:2-iminobutanoate/2-iminopropanoate deaminase
MKRIVISRENAATAGHPFSPGIRFGNLVFVSGQVGADPVTRNFAPDIESQTRQTLENVKAVAEAGGASLGTALKITVYMTDMTNEFAAMNTVFREYFPSDPPSRTTVGIAHLARPGLKIEMDMIAYVQNPDECAR